MRYRRLLAIAFLIAATVIGGCGKNAEPGKQVPAKQQQVQPGGQLVYGSLQEPNTLNPYMSDLLATAEVSSLIFSGLVVTNDKGEWLPDLAVEVPTVQNGGVSSDGLTVTYRLKQNITWHDGMPFTAEDVKFTWQTIMNRQVHVVSRDGYDKIASVETPDKYTVVIRYKELYAPYLTLFPAILSKHSLENAGDINKAQYNRAPIGTGPFKFKDWRLAESIVLDANQAYHKGKPNLESVMYKIIPDSNILLTQLKVGQVDLVSNIAIGQLEQVRAIDGVRAVVTPSMIWEHFDFNLDLPVFQDVRVRKAIQLAIDRQGIITSLKNIASPATGDQTPLSWAHNPAVQAAPRDVNAAKAMLVQAGWSLGEDGVFAKEGRKLAFSIATTAGNKTRETVAQQIIQQLREAGIVAELRPVEVPVFFGDTLKNRRFETALYAWVAGIDPDNVSLWHSKRIPGRANDYEGQNYPGWRNAEVDNLTEQGIRTADLERRRPIYQRIQELIDQEVPVVPLYFRANIDAVRNNVVNYKPNPTPAGNFWNAWEWGKSK